MDKGKRMLINYVSLLGSRVDPVALTAELEKQGDITKEDAEQVYLVPSDGCDFGRSEKWDVLSRTIKTRCSPASFMQALSNSGYDKLATELSLLWLKILDTPHRNEEERKSQGYLVHLKSDIHQNAYRDPPKYIELRSRKHYRQMQNASGGDMEMNAADKYAVCLCLLADNYTLRYTSQLPEHDYLRQLEEMIPQTSNTHLAEIACKSRMAIADAMAGNVEKGERYMNEAQMAAFHITYNSPTIYEMMYYLIHFNCIKAMTDPTIQKDEILRLAKESLGVLNDGTKVVLFWKRMVLVRVAFFLLGIGHTGNLSPEINVEKEDVDTAKKLLAEVDKVWDGIELLRKMLYYVARARIQELELFAVENCEDDHDYTVKVKKVKAIVRCLRATLKQVDATVAEDPDGYFSETVLVKAYPKYCKTKSKVSWRRIAHEIGMYMCPQIKGMPECHNNR